MARGTEVISRDGREVGRLEELARQNEVGVMVVGLPRRMDGSLGDMAREVQDFGESLSSRLGIPLEMWDERLSTAEAEKRLITAGYRRKRRKEVIDSLAAEIILQGFLDRQARKEK